MAERLKLLNNEYMGGEKSMMMKISSKAFSSARKREDLSMTKDNSNMPN